MEAWAGLSQWTARAPNAVVKSRLNMLTTTPEGLEINEKIQSQFCEKFENLVAISQILVAKSLCCIVLSAV